MKYKCPVCERVKEDPTYTLRGLPCCWAEEHFKEGSIPQMIPIVDINDNKMV